MILNYFKHALRLMARNPFFAGINVLGLSVGFAVFFVLWPFTVSEFRSDRFIKDHERISRILLDWNWSEDGGKSWGHLILSYQLTHIGNELHQQNLIEEFTRLRVQQNFGEISTPGLKANLIVTVERGPDNLYTIREEKAICADKNIFDFFNLDFVVGDRTTALEKAESVTISEQNAMRIFGRLPETGEWIKVNDQNFMVSGIFRDLPSNSHLQFDMVFSNAKSLANWNQPATGMPWAFQYCKMKHQDDDLTAILTKNYDHLMGWYEKENPHIKCKLFSQPLTEIVFSENYNNDTFQNKSKFSLTVLASVSISILLMAWMNYVNLTISQTKTRFKEIAARKVSGALTKDLFIQFAAQATVVNLIAAALGTTLIQLIRQPFFELFRIRVISFADLDDDTLVFFFILFISGIFITSFYPAFVAHRFSARQLLGQRIIGQKRFISSSLTTVQYTIALVLIALIFISSSQLHFILSKDLGINKENVVIVEAPLVGLQENVNERMSAFAKQVELLTQPIAISLSGRVVGDDPYNAELRRPGDQVFYAFDSYGGVDEKFVELYGLKIIAGRNFQTGEKGNSIMLSKLAVKRLGFHSPEEAIGTIVVPASSPEPQIKIIAVFDDFRANPFFAAKGSTEAAPGRGVGFSNISNGPAFLQPQRVSVKLKEGQLQEFITITAKLYEDMFPGNLFNWYFLDKHINRHYEQQQVIRNQISFFTFLAVAVACLGLLGMITNRVADKLKEISIRRILGARHLHISSVLLDTTFKQIAIAMALGFPIAWKLANEYLQRYTERIALHWWHFSLPLAILLLIMFVTIATVLWNAARSNPVEALKHE